MSKLRQPDINKLIGARKAGEEGTFWAEEYTHAVDVIWHLKEENKLLLAMQPACRDAIVVKLKEKLKETKKHLRDANRGSELSAKVCRVHVEEIFRCREENEALQKDRDEFQKIALMYEGVLNKYDWVRKNNSCESCELTKNYAKNVLLAAREVMEQAEPQEKEKGDEQ